MSPLWGGSLVQEGILCAQEIPGNCQLALDKQTDSPVIAQEGVNERYWSKEKGISLK